MPKATGATPPEGFGPELPGRDPAERATTVSSREPQRREALREAMRIKTQVQNNKKILTDSPGGTQRAVAGHGDGAQIIVWQPPSLGPRGAPYGLRPHRARL